MESELVQTINNIAGNIDALAQPRFIDWLAVFLSGFSIIVSGAAICFAIRVANKQNKIALFEKRFVCFQLLERFIKLYECIEDTIDTENILKAFHLVMFDVVKMEELDSKLIIEKLLEHKRIIYQMQFLFPNVDRDNILNLHTAYNNFYCATLNGKNIDEMCRIYRQTMDDFIRTDYQRICRYLEVSNT